MKQKCCYIFCTAALTVVALLVGCQTRGTYDKHRYAVQTAYLNGQISMADYLSSVDRINRAEEKSYRYRMAACNFLAVMGNVMKQQGNTSQYTPIATAHAKSTYFPQPTVQSLPSKKNSDEGTYLGRANNNQFDPESVANPYGVGNPYKPDGINNPYSKYGSKFSPYSANNPFATSAPKLVDDEGNYRGRLSLNPYDQDSISNPFGRYGNPYSPDSINNPFWAGDPYGKGLKIIGE